MYADNIIEVLPDGLLAAVELATGANVSAVRACGGGGASREGAELDLNWPDGRAQTAYMNYDINRAGAGDDAAFLREAAVIRALSTTHQAAGVRVAPFIAAIPEMRALVGGFVEGEPNFNTLTAADDRLAVATDFMDQLAKLHRIDVAASPVEGMGPIEPVESVIVRHLEGLRTRNSGKHWDPLIQLSVDWLCENIPANLPAPVIVHGDAGPANFLYADGQVTALLDWELCHYGDPMADLAMICLRALFQPFVPMPQAFAAYEAAGGHVVDLARVRYWRLLFQTGFARATRYSDPEAPPPPNLGMNMVYSTIHRRVLSEALAEAAGVALEPVSLPDAPEGPRHRAFAIALDDLRDMIVPRLPDQQAAVKAKGLARLVKWWRDIERYEPAFLEAERREIGEALDHEFALHADAWAALCGAIAARTLSFATAIRLINAHVTREAALMTDAMGGLARTQFAPLA
jgi:prepilin-type processing-associated H-X9-DG protein